METTINLQTATIGYWVSSFAAGGAASFVLLLGLEVIAWKRNHSWRPVRWLMTKRRAKRIANGYRVAVRHGMLTAQEAYRRWARDTGYVGHRLGYHWRHDYRHQLQGLQPVPPPRQHTTVDDLGQSPRRAGGSSAGNTRQ